MKKLTNHIILFLPVMLLLALAACSKMDEYKDIFLQDGEVQYTGKADSVRFHSGYHRAQLSWLILSDPKVTHAKIYWNFRRDSTEISIRRSAVVDTIRLMIPDLEEGPQTFEIFTFDKYGHSSIPSLVSGRVNGERYEASLLQRSLNRGACSVINIQPPYHGAILVWQPGSATDGMIGVQVRYTDEDAVEQRVFAEPAAPSTMLMKYSPGASIEYRTMYKPDSLAIDTFYARPTTLELN